jgi:hypothetical protein
MRAPIWALGGLVLVAAGCGDDGWDRFDTNEIVFGIQQRTTADQKKEVRAGYEFLRLSDKGGWSPYVFRDGDGEGTCYFEHYGERLGRPHVESGVATFTGGKLAGSGLQILANQPDETRQEGVGWADGDVLTFSASGFAMPTIPAMRIVGPRTGLEVTSVLPVPAEPGAAIAIKATDPVSVSWKPVTDGPASRVMVSLETEEEGGPGSQVRCFGWMGSGSAIIPATWVGRLFSSIDPGKPVKGHISVATHRQLTILSRGNWATYVVATAVHKDEPFEGVR